MNTIKKDIIFKGIGIHSAKNVTLTVSPTKKQGIFFVFKNKKIETTINSVGFNHFRATTLIEDNITIQTPEHFLSACYALELSNIEVSLNQNELPILDGSAILFIEKLKDELVPIKDFYQDKIQLKNDIYINYQDSHYFGFPNNKLIIDVYLSYPDDWIKSMSFRYIHSKSNFINEIAPARTYGFTHEIDMLREKGLAKGGSLENALVISEDGYLNKPRFEDEIVRHKILDFIGDISITGKRLLGHYVLIKPSHQGNCEFIKSL